MRFSPVLSVYIARKFLAAFFGALGLIMGLIYLFDVIELLRRAATHGNAGLLVILEMALMKLPQMVQTILPFAVMIGAMSCFWAMTRSRELVVSRSAGISVWQFLAPVLGVVALIGLFDVTAFDPLSARMYRLYERLEDQQALRSGSPLQVNEDGLWLRETHGDEVVVVHADHVWQRGLTLRLRTVSVFVTDTHMNFDYRLEAKTGVLGHNSFHLEDVALYRRERPVVLMPAYDFDTDLTMARVMDSFATPETVSFWELPGFIRFFESSGFSASRQKLYFQSMLASPLLLCAMVLLAAAFSVNPDMRSGGVAKRLAGGVVAGFLFYFFSKVIYALGLSATLPVLMAAWIPSLVAGLIGVAALFHLEDG